MFYQNKKRHHKILGRSKLTAALKAEVILADSKRRDFILQIQNALGFESIRFQQLIQPLLNQIAENYQLFPSNEHRFYALPGGLLDYALYRAQAAMYIFRQSILPPDTKTLSESQALWAYVLLTAALLRGSGVLYTHYQVECFDDQGHSMGFWKPLDEDFFSTTPFYTLENHFDYPEGLSEFLTLFLAKRWMPSTGFQWIASDAEMLCQWLKLLKEEKEGLGILEAILERAEAIAWQLLTKDVIHLASFNLPSERARYSAFGQAPSSLIPQEILGLQFLIWLKENLARGQMILNQNYLHLTDLGLVIEPEAFKWFAQQQGQNQNWHLVKKALMSLHLNDKDFSQKDAILLTQWKLFLPKELIVKQIQGAQHFKVQSLALNYGNNAKLFVEGKSMDLDFQNKRLNTKGQMEQIKHDRQVGLKNV